MSSWPPPLSDPAYLTYLAVFGAAALGCLAGAGRARHIEDAGVRRGLVGLLGTSGLWAFAHVGVLLAPTLGLKIALYEVGLTIGFETVWAWLWLCSAYSGRTLHLRRAAQWTALSVFVAAVVTKLTNPWHGLYFSAALGSGPFPHLRVDHHAAYWVTSSVSYVLAGIGFFMLVEPLRRIRVGTGRLATLFGLTALPLAANAIGYATPLLLDLSYVPVGVAAFSVGALFVYRSRFAETGRAGRTEKPVLVVTEGGRPRNYNEAAAGVFPALEKPAIGKRLDATLPEVTEALAENASAGAEGGEEEKRKTIQVGQDALQREEDSTEAVGSDEGPDAKTEEDARHFRLVESPFGPGPGRLVVLEDVTEEVLRRRAAERKRKEQARRRLKRYREYTSRMVDAIDDLFFVLSEAGRLERWNRRFREVTGYTDEEIGQMSAVDFVPEGHRTQVEAEIERVLSTGDGQVKVPLLRKGGSTIPYEFIGDRIEDPDGNPRAVVVGRDISERLERERALEQKNDLFERAQRIANVGAWERDVQEGESLVTGQACRIHGLGPDEDLTPERSLEFYHPDDRPTVREAFRRAIEDGEPYDVEARLITDEGEERWVRTRGEPQREDGRPEGEVVRVRGTIQDVTERKEAERERRQADTFFENAQDALFLVDVERGGGEPTFRVQRVNPAYEEATGLSTEDVEGHRPRDIVGDEQGAWIEHRYRECTRRREPLEYEEELPIAGTTYWQTRIAPVTVEGTAQKIVGSTRDVTDRRRRIGELERYERMVENLPVGTFRTTASGDFVELNEALTEIYGGSEQELREAGTEALYPDPADRDALIETLRHEGKVEGRLIRVQTLAGDERWVRATITFVEEEGERYLDGIVQDVTEERRRKEELARQNDLFERAQKIANVDAWEYDVQSGTFTLTEQGYRIHGLDPDGDMTPNRSHELFRPEDRRKADEVFQRAIEDGEPYDIEAHLTTEGGEERWVRSRGEPQREDGEVVRVRGAIQNITDQKKREEALREAKEEAEEAARLKTAVLANMSHEIRTPLTPVIGYAESLADDLDGPEARVAERIERSAQRLQETLDSVLRLAQLEAGTLDLDRKEIDLRAVVREAAGRVGRAAEERPTLEMDLPGHPVRGRVSEGGVRRIVENLLENAVKLTPEGGRVEVRLRDGPEGRSGDDAGRGAEEVVLEVEDTGIGIREEAQAEIFEAFEQESKGWAREYEGTGLGLSVVQRLAEAHGGTVRVESEKGEGSRFAVRLPGAGGSEEPAGAETGR